MFRRPGSDIRQSEVENSSQARDGTDQRISQARLTGVRPPVLGLGVPQRTDISYQDRFADLGINHPVMSSAVVSAMSL